MVKLRFEESPGAWSNNVYRASRSKVFSPGRGVCAPAMRICHYGIILNVYLAHRDVSTLFKAAAIADATPQHNGRME